MEPSYVREARLAQQRFDHNNPVQLEIGGLMLKKNAMTFEQMLKLKEIFDGDYDITRMKLEFVADTNYLHVDLNDGNVDRHVRIMPDGRIMQTKQVEVEL